MGVALDMRMDAETGPTAAGIPLLRVPHRAVGSAARGRTRPAHRRWAARIVRRRRATPPRTSDDLVAVLESVLGRRASHAEKARLFPGGANARQRRDPGAHAGRTPRDPRRTPPGCRPCDHLLSLGRGPDGQEGLPGMERSVSRSAVPASRARRGVRGHGFAADRQAGHARRGGNRRQPRARGRRGSGPGGEQA